MRPNTHYPLYALGVTIFNLRISRNMSQEAVSKASGLSRNIIAKIERGESDPKITTLARIYRALGYRIRVATSEMKNYKADSQPRPSRAAKE